MTFGKNMQKTLESSLLVSVFWDTV